MGLRRKVAEKASYKEAEDLVTELFASGHYEDVYVMKDGDVYEVWVEDIEEE